MSLCVFSASADADLIQIHDYIAQDNVVAARSVVIRIRERCVTLADTPLIGRARPEIGAESRSIPFRGTPYTIVYRPINNGIEILRIRHGRQDLPGPGA